jgi:hypothetical protein
MSLAVTAKAAAAASARRNHRLFEQYVALKSVGLAGDSRSIGDN